MKYKLLIVILIHSLKSYSQEIVVKSVKIRETSENRYASEIPRVKDLSNNKSPIVEKINSQILDRFMIKSYKQSEIEDFRWNDIKYSSEIKEEILYLSISGEFYGAYPVYVEYEFYFDLKTGEPLKLSIIPFQALFSLSGYFDFLNKYWLEGVKKEFITATECAEFEPYCSYYDIDSYSVNDNKLSISLPYDCYPHVVQACSPEFGVSVEMDTLKPYLSEVGRYILYESDYLSKTPIEKFLENLKLKKKIQNNLFIFGKIDDKYPISMAININNLGEISGYYYYDSKLQKLSLDGKEKENTLFLTETVHNKQTGFFEISIISEIDSKGFLEFDSDESDKYLIGKWMNSDKTKIFELLFTDIRTNYKN